MATLLNSESRRLYSWWWDSHISPKNSKWLQENLTDMDAKVKAMIKLIEEDADSFARRAEMYYKKRPELMKLVEEFYRAYRALAERYDHLTGELRQAQRTMAEAFSSQVPFELDEESPSGSSRHDTEIHTPDAPQLGLAQLVPEKNRINFENSDSGISKRGLKQLHEMIGPKDNAEENVEGQLGEAVNHGAECQRLHAKVLQLSNESENLKLKALSESERAVKAESDVQNLKRALADVQAEKDSVFIQYQICLEKLTNLEAELMRAQNDSMRFNDQAITAEAEVQAMKEALTSLEIGKEAALIKQRESMERIIHLEGLVSHAKEDLEAVHKKLFKAENEALNLTNEISLLESEKNAGLQSYNHCLEKICHLENKISLAEKDAEQFKQENDLAETEVRRLKKAIAELNEEKELSAQQYKNCLNRMSELENDISRAKEDVKHLDTEVLMGAMKLKNSEEKCNLLEISNQSLHLEVADLAKKIAMKDEELSKKQEELERLQVSVQDEHLRYVRVEAMLQTLQDIHSQSQEEHRALALELKTRLQMLKDLKVHKHELEDEVRRVKDENHSLSELKMSSSISIENLQNEILCLRKMKERLEEEVAQQIGQSNSLQKEILSLKEEMWDLTKRYQALLDKLESVGLDQDNMGPSIKNLQDENSRLRQICEKESNEKGALSKKLEGMEELSKKICALESSLLEVYCELEASHQKVREMQETCQFIHGEKAILVAEKAALLSEVQILTDNMQKVLEKNAVLENSLMGAKVDLEGLKEKSKGLEEIYQLLKNEKSDLLTERGMLVVQLANVERSLECMEKRFTGLEEKYADLEKENKSMHSEVLELRASIGAEKHERTSSTLQSETRLISLEHHIHILQEENRWRKKEFEDEVDKTVRGQFEFFILQKFIQDMEEKNYSLLIECQKLVEASKLADKLISELEGENLEQQVEAELLVNEIEKLRLGIYQVFRVLGGSPDSVFKDMAENEQMFVHRIIGNIEDIKHSLLKSKDDELLLLVENSVLLTLLSQMKMEGTEIKSKKDLLEQDLDVIMKKHVMVQNDYDRLLEMNRQLKSEVSEGNQQIKLVEAEVQCHSVKLVEMEKAYSDLQGQYLEVLDENRYLLEGFSDLKEERSLLEMENDVILQEALALANFSTVLESLGSEKLLKLNVLYEDMANLTGVKDDLEKNISTLKGKVAMKEAENFFLKDSVRRLEIELVGVRESNHDLKQEILDVKDVLIQREAEILEVEQKLKEEENLNSELCKTVDVLKAGCQRSTCMRENMEKHLLKLSEDNGIRNKEIEGLRELNANLVSELSQLQEEYEVQMTREETLSSELKAKNDEFELWEAEAAAFYFDLQISSIHRVLYENKVYELAKVCVSLEDDTTSKTFVIEEMKGKLSLMENEIGELKAQLSAYAPVIGSLRDDVASLEHKALLPKMLLVADALEPTCTDVGVDYHENYCAKPTDMQSPMPTGIQDLQKLQSRIKAVEKAMVEEINELGLQERLNAKGKEETVEDEIEELKPQRSSSHAKAKDKEKKVLRSNLRENLNLQNDKPEAIDVRKGILMKDIQLDQVSESPAYGSCRIHNGATEGVDDQMLELWETAEKNGLARIVSVLKKPILASTGRDLKSSQLENMEQKSGDSSTCCEVEKELGVDKLEVSSTHADSNQDVNNRKILERLSSDAQKLAGLQMTVQNLKRKLDTNKKSRKPRDVDLDTVKEQLQEVEETVVQLVDLNGQLVKNIEESPSWSEGKASGELKETSSFRRKKVSEQARKGSEKIGRLQLEVQKIEYILLKLDDEKKSKGRSRFSRSRTSIILRDFIYSGRKNSGKKKKARFCGCFKPSTNCDANRM